MATILTQQQSLQQVPDSVSEDDSSAEANDEEESLDSDSSVEDDAFEQGIQGTSPTQIVFNVVKGIVGEGMLSLPAGIAAGTGLAVGCLITAAFGVLLAYTFSTMGRVCHETGAKTHKECAAAVRGPGLAQLGAIVIMCKTAFTCIAYAMVIGQSYSRIFEFFGLHGWFVTRQFVLVVIVVVILAPLCLQRDLSILSYTSLFGILCEFSVLVFMQYRFLDGSYAPNGQYYQIIPSENRVDFGEPNYPHEWNVTLTTFVLLASLSTAFIAHYNAPKFYIQMRRRSPRRFTRVVAVAFAIAFGIFVWAMSVGYLTFGAHANGNILNNYSDTDPGAAMARIAIGFAVMFGFPLSFTALRDSTISTFNLRPEKKRHFLLVTVLLLVVITACGAYLDDLGLLNALGGAIFGSFITLIFPALLMFFLAQKMLSGEMGRKERMGSQRIALERNWSVVLVVLGFILMCFGSVIVIMKKFFPQELGLT